MEILNLSSETFWKGETEIRGEVDDKGERYEVRILQKDGQVFEFSCVQKNSLGGRLSQCGLSSGRTGNGTGLAMCEHGQAVFRAWLLKQEEKPKRQISTSQKIRFMVREYTNREVNKILGDTEAGDIRVTPRVCLSGEELKLTASVGREKMYPIRNLTSFVQAVKQGKQAEYGRGFSFVHSLRAFSEESRPFVLFLMEQVELYREYYGKLRRASWETEPSFRELSLGKAAGERFFSIMEGRQILWEDGGRERGMLPVRRENPGILLKVRGEGDGAALSLAGDIAVFPGESHLVIREEEVIRICDKEYTEALAILMEYMAVRRDAEPRLLVGSRDLPLFYERILKRLDKLGLVETENLSLRELKPQELRAAFYFDSTGPDRVSLRPELSYGDFSFHPLDDGQVPKDVCRDVPGEFRISRLITEYFRCKEDGTKDLVIQDDEAAVFALLSRGIPQFMELGEVFVSESFQKIRVLPPANMSLSARVGGGWLEVSLDTGELPREELLKALAAYEKKKKFYRMKNGDFLTLDDGGLVSVSRLAKILDTEKLLSGTGTVRLPLNKAVFLEDSLRGEENVTFYRDKLFQAMVQGIYEQGKGGFPVPPGMDTLLREYQKAGYQWLRNLDQYGFGGILADEMGLGKTVQIIALLADEKRRSGEMSLIVCPASLVYNWANELASFAPELSVRAVAGTQEERRELLLNLDGADVVLTSYDLLKRDLLLYGGLSFRFQILDEAQYIKNGATQTARSVKAVTAKTRFALTGTPIENHLGELWSIFDFLMPGFLFTSPKFKKRFETPIVRDGDRMALSELKKLTGPFILRRLKTDVLKELPQKLELVLYSAMEGEQKRLYTAHAQELRERLEDGGEIGGRERIQILSELLMLRQICCEPSLCFPKYRGGSAKLDTCMELLENGVQSGHKILLFSQFTTMLDLIAGRLKKEKLPFHMLTGATPKRERIRMVSEFQEDDVQIFLISLKAGGTGLNLTAADMVIHYDPWWNVAAQNQATDRAHRIGQKNKVTVFRLITKHTVEENILLLQEKKQKLADVVVTEGGGVMERFSKEELLKLLEE